MRALEAKNSCEGDSGVRTPTSDSVVRPFSLTVALMVSPSSPPHRPIDNDTTSGASTSFATIMTMSSSPWWSGPSGRLSSTRSKVARPAAASTVIRSRTAARSVSSWRASASAVRCPSRHASTPSKAVTGSDRTR